MCVRVNAGTSAIADLPVLITELGVDECAGEGFGLVSHERVRLFRISVERIVKF